MKFKDWLQMFLEEKVIPSFKDGKYIAEVMEVYYSLLTKGVLIQDAQSLIRTVQESWLRKCG